MTNNVYKHYLTSTEKGLLLEEIVLKLLSRVQ